MKKHTKILALAAAFVLAACAAGCGSDSSSTSAGAATSEIVSAIPKEEMQAATAAKAEEPAETKEEAVVEEPQGAEIPEGMYLSELTGEPIDEAIKDQRPIAVMVDNEKMALPHYGTAEADIVYEMMNSTANDRITRFMCIFKDWESIKQLGSIRSTRPTNIILASEYNAVLCHDGGPYHNDAYFAKKALSEHFSGTFSRVSNGKDWEFTEYIVTGDLDKNFTNSGYSKTYNTYAPQRDSHFVFTAYGTKVDLAKKYEAVIDVTDIKLPFKHNSSELHYNASTGTYDFYEYGSIHQDAEDGETLTFENVILQCCDFVQLDSNGYLIYNCIDSVEPAWYITEGKCIPLYWEKTSETDITKFYDANGDEVVINTGKTYIGIIPSDSWDQVKLTPGLDG